MNERDAARWRAYALAAAANLGLGPDDAEDAAQAALVALLAPLGDHVLDPEGYRRRTVGNAVRMHLRAMRARGRDWALYDGVRYGGEGGGDEWHGLDALQASGAVAPHDPWDAVDRGLAAGAELAGAREAILSLTPLERRVLLLTAEGRSDAEIGELVGRRPGAVEDLRYKARRKAREAHP